MLKVDLICNQELLPRLRLLTQHMQKLGVRLRLHTEPPLNCSEKLIVAATAKHPIEVEPADEVEVIGLYLESEPVLIDAHYHVHIPTWPARSSDPDVDTLVAYLKKEREPKVAKPSTTPSRKPKTKRWAWVGLLAAIGIAIGIGAQFLDFDSPDELAATDLAQPEAQSKVQPQVPSKVQSGVQSKTQSQTQPQVSNSSPSETFERPDDPLPSSHAVQPWLQSDCPIALTQSQKALSRYACIRCESESNALASSSL